MYSVLRNKTKYEERHWKRPLNSAAALAELTMSA
jgi:hypothetical protein